MQELPEPAVLESPGEMPKRGVDAKQSRDRKFWMAMAAYGILAVLIWFTVGEGTILAFGKRVEIRWIPLAIIGTFVFRTYIVREAEKLRRRSEEES
jgi:hypothetical protein